MGKRAAQGSLVGSTYQAVEPYSGVGYAQLLGREDEVLHGIVAFP